MFSVVQGAKAIRALAFVAALAVPTFAAARGDLPIEWNKEFAGQPLNLSNAPLVFDEEFDQAPNLRGPKLFAPVHDSYGASVFDPPNGAAYHWTPGALEIVAYKDGAGGWRSGNVQTVDAAGRGFSCESCYFEARLKFPRGVNTAYWSAFWLLSADRPKTGHVEIDAIEWYGSSPFWHHHALHISPRALAARQYRSDASFELKLGDGDWHTYGVSKTKSLAIVYFDGHEVRRAQLPAVFDVPLYMLATLAIQDKDADRAPDPMRMEIDYIRAYRLGGR
jgi:hypothetical protein